MKRLYALLTGPYDRFKGNPTTGNYFDLGQKTKAMEMGIFQLIMKFAVYASAIAFIVSGIMIIIAGHSGGQSVNKAKSYLIRVFVISLLIFGVTGLINLVQGAGWDATKNLGGL